MTDSHAGEGSGRGAASTDWPFAGEGPRDPGDDAMRRMSFDDVARVIDTTVESDSLDVLSRLRVNLMLLWPDDPDADLLARVIARRLERLGPSAGMRERAGASDVLVPTRPTLEPVRSSARDGSLAAASVVRPMGVPGVANEA